MAQSTLQQLMGIESSGDYSKAIANWTSVERRIHTHPNEVLIDHTPKNDYHSFSPLYIALRNEVRPVPSSTVHLLLEVNPDALTDDLICVVLSNPHGSKEIMSTLLELKPRFALEKFRFWKTPLHAASRIAQSWEALESLIDANPDALATKDSHGRIPLFEACCQGSPEIVELLIRKGKEQGLKAGGLFDSDDNGMSPIHVVVSKLSFLNRGNKQVIWSNKCYLNSSDFTLKCINTWKKLVICLIHGSGLFTSGLVNGNWHKALRMILFSAIEVAAMQKKGALKMVADLDFDHIFHLLLDKRYCDPEEIASFMDEKGMLPFQKAVQMKLKRDDGLLYILDAYPEAVLKDLPECILPKVLEIFSKRSEHALIYRLLRNFPSAISGHTTTNKTVKRTCTDNPDCVENLVRQDNEEERLTMACNKKLRAGSHNIAFE